MSSNFLCLINWFSDMEQFVRFCSFMRWLLREYLFSLRTAIVGETQYLMNHCFHEIQKYSLRISDWNDGKINCIFKLPNIGACWFVAQKKQIQFTYVSRCICSNEMYNHSPETKKKHLKHKHKLYFNNTDIFSIYNLRK